MPKVPDARCHHCDFRFVRGFDDFFIGDRTAGLDNGLDAGFGGQLNIIRFGNKRVGNKNRIVSVLAGFGDRGYNSPHTAGLTATDTDGAPLLDQKDGVGFNAFDDPPAEEHRFQLLRGRFLFGDKFQFILL